MDNNEIQIREEFEKELKLRKMKKYNNAERFFESLKFSKYGVPYLTQDKIESLAEIFLSIYAANVFSKPQTTPILEIVNELVNQNKLTLDFTCKLESKGNERVLGKTIFSKKLILIDKSLFNVKQRFNFVLGHELGHLFLHTRKKIIDDHKVYVNFSEDKAKHFFLSPHQSFSVRNQIEWQANAFSAAILMPRKIFVKGLTNVQNKLSINRNIGIIYIDETQNKKQDFIRIIGELSSLFNSSPSAVKYRLYNLNLVVDVTKRKTSFLSISDVLKQAKETFH